MGIWDINIGGIFDGLFDIGKELIEDKDKRNEFNMKIAEAKTNLKLAELKAETAHETALLSQTTNPKVDAFVKLLLALVPLMRPIGTALMTGAGIYMSIKGIQVDPRISVGLVSAFPAWGLSRHILRNKELIK